MMTCRVNRLLALRAAVSGTHPSGFTAAPTCNTTTKQSMVKIITDVWMNPLCASLPAKTWGEQAALRSVMGSWDPNWCPTEIQLPTETQLPTAKCSGSILISWSPSPPNSFVNKASSLSFYPKNIYAAYQCGKKGFQPFLGAYRCPHGPMHLHQHPQNCANLPKIPCKRKDGASGLNTSTHSPASTACPRA